jgi:hypothetical protein
MQAYAAVEEQEEEKVLWQNVPSCDDIIGEIR